MTYRENIIEDFKKCIQVNGYTHCNECYFKERNEVKVICKELVDDILILLKEHEDEKPVIDEFGRCFLNALKQQLDMKLQMIELLITPEFAEKVVKLIEQTFD